MAHCKFQLTSAKWLMNQAIYFMNTIAYTNDLKLEITPIESTFLTKTIGFKFIGTDHQIIQTMKIIKEWVRMNDIT